MIVIFLKKKTLYFSEVKSGTDSEVAQHTRSGGGGGQGI